MKFGTKLGLFVLLLIGVIIWVGRQYAKPDFEGVIIAITPQNELTEAEQGSLETDGTIWYSVKGKTPTGVDTVLHVTSGSVNPKYIVPGKKVEVQYYRNVSEMVNVKD